MILNIFRTHLLAVINNISVWWHVLGVAVIIALLVFVPDDHASFSFVFGERLNNTGLNGGSTGGLFFIFYLLPVGFLLTQYTITGYDASAHISEETHGAAKNAARGVWQLDLLLGDHRLARAAGDHLRGSEGRIRLQRRQRLRRRLVAGDLQPGADHVRVQDPADHLHGRASCSAATPA